jgi:hypothetical protein
MHDLQEVYKNSSTCALFTHPAKDSPRANIAAPLTHAHRRPTPGRSPAANGTAPPFTGQGWPENRLVARFPRPGSASLLPLSTMAAVRATSYPLSGNHPPDTLRSAGVMCPFRPPSPPRPPAPPLGISMPLVSRGRPVRRAAGGSAGCLGPRRWLDRACRTPDAVQGSPGRAGSRGGAPRLQLEAPRAPAPRSQGENERLGDLGLDPARVRCAAPTAVSSARAV